MRVRLITVINAKAKGKRGELAAVKLCEKLGLKNPRRGLSQGAGPIEAGLVCDSTKAYWIECKYTEKGRCIFAYLEQAEEGSRITPKIPIVLCGAGNKEFLVIGDAKYLLAIHCGHTI